MTNAKKGKPMNTDEETVPHRKITASIPINVAVDFKKLCELKDTTISYRIRMLIEREVESHRRVIARHGKPNKVPVGLPNRA